MVERAVDESDMRDVLRATPDRYLVLAPDFTIVEATDAFLATTRTKREELVGRSVLDAFPDDDLRTSLAAVLTDRTTHTMPVLRRAYAGRRAVVDANPQPRVGSNGQRQVHRVIASKT